MDTSSLWEKISIRPNSYPELSQDIEVIAVQPFYQNIYSEFDLKTAKFIADLINRKAKHTYMATGYFADGLIYGPLADIIFRDTILDKKNPFINTYQSNRFDPIASASFFIKENSNIFMQYMKDFSPFHSKNYNNIKLGEGKILKINKEKCAVSRDKNNKLHIVSAICQHMQCIVSWNKTWDCLCHGSRFTQCGKVIEDPAVSNLENKEI